MKNWLIIKVAWLLGVAKYIGPIIKTGSRTYKLVKNKYVYLKKDGDFSAKDKKELLRLIIEQTPEFGDAIIDLLESQSKK